MNKNIYKSMYKDENAPDFAICPRIKIMADIANSLNLENKNILDIGCYDGTMLSKITNKNNLYGVEASDYGIRESAKKNINVKNFFFDDKTPLPFENNFFDLVIAGEIIEHIYDTDFFLEEIKRVLKHGGKLLISTPNIASFGRRIMLLFGINPIIELSPNQTDSSGHIRYFTFKTLRDLLVKHGFSRVSSQSDIVNFSKHGKARSAWPAKIFPSIGQSIIYLYEKQV